MTLITEIKNNNIELAASILYSIPIGGVHPPRKYVSVLPSLTVCINNNDIIRQPNAPTKLSNQDNVFKFQLKNKRNIDRKTVNLLRNKEISAIIS